MIVDNLELIDGVVANLVIETVSVLPTVNAIIARTIYLDTVDGVNDPGLYVHDGTTWHNISDEPDLSSKLDKSGDTMTGSLILDADPSVALGAATKQYVDDKDSFAVIVQTNAVTLTANAVNELQTSNTFTLPPANSVPGGSSIIVELSDKYNTFIPIVQRGGSDNIAYREGVDTSFIFDSGTLSVRFISNGVDEWRL